MNVHQAEHWRACLGVLNIGAHRTERQFAAPEYDRPQV
jgi:hypothetical protein